MDRFAGCWGHRAQRDCSRRYVEGLISKAERKSMQGVWGAIRDPGSYQAIQHFITISQWDPEPVWRKLREQIPERRGVLIIDDTGFPKQGTHSVGVQRQYSGTMGRVANCQVAVSTVLRTKRTTWPIAMDLYLPEVWADDMDRRESAAVPTSSVFQPKWQIALGQVVKARRAKIQIECVVSDSGYGECTEFRDRLDRMHLRYVVAVTGQTTVFSAPPRLKPPRTARHVGRPRKHHRLARSSPKPERLKELATSLPAGAWKRIAWRLGTKGPMRADFAAMRVVPAHRWSERKQRSTCWLLCERLRDGSFKFYLSNLPEDTSLKRLVDVAHTRWAVEQNYQQLKEELGLDHFEGRTWTGWHHHVLLTVLTFVFLEAERSRRDAEPFPTFPAMRRLLSEILFIHMFDERPDLQDVIAEKFSERRGRGPP